MGRSCRSFSLSQRGQNTFFHNVFGPLTHFYRDATGAGHFSALGFNQIPEQEILRALIEIGKTTIMKHWSSKPTLGLNETHSNQT